MIYPVGEIFRVLGECKVIIITRNDWGDVYDCQCLSKPQSNQPLEWDRENLSESHSSFEWNIKHGHYVRIGNIFELPDWIVKEETQ